MRVGRAVSQPRPCTCLLVGFFRVSFYQWDAIFAVDLESVIDPLQQSRMTRAQFKGEAKSNLEKKKDINQTTRKTISLCLK